MKVVLDTNVIVSALLKTYSIPAEILRMFISGELILCYDTRIITEYKEVLMRDKFKFDKNDIDDILFYIEHSGDKIAAGKTKYKTLDKDDQMFLEAGIFGRAKFIITGNKADYPADVKEIKIVTPKEFIEKYCKCK